MENESTALVVIDVQEKLAPAMQDAEALVEQIGRMLRGAAILDLPVLVTEHVPEKLGPTVRAVAEAWPVDCVPLRKQMFSCCADAAFMERLAKLGRRTVLLCGIESHVCVTLTAMDLIAAGYEVQVVSDAVSSRLASNCELGLHRIERAGGIRTGVEMALFELQREAAGDRFRALLRVLR